jgi:hypothetical protein
MYLEIQMANHVENQITVIGNQAALAEFQHIFSNIEDGIKTASFLPPSNDDDYQSRNWMIEHVGAKWAYIEDAEENWVKIVSAWSSIFPFVQQLGSHLQSLDPSVRLELTYIDEAYNFAGAAVFTENGWNDEEADSAFFENFFTMREISAEDEYYSIQELINSWVKEMI